MDNCIGNARGRFLTPLAMMLAIGIGQVTQTSHAAEPTRDSTALIREYADAGEFVPAIQAAHKLATLAERDSQLAWIAFQQFRAGGRSSAFVTVSEIENETLRAHTYKDLNGLPRRSISNAQGGGSQADFESLIDLITSTVRPPSWDLVGGPGSVKGFAGGVYVDAAGLLKRSVKEDHFGLDDLKNGSRRNSVSANNTDSPNTSAVRKTSALRKVSLTVLEREVQRRTAAGESLPEEMELLAGLQRIKYLLVYPDTHEIIVAGTGCDWQRDTENRPVNTATGHPVVQLNDLIVVLRHEWKDREPEFGCSIDPTKQGLQNAQTFATESSKTPLKPGQRDGWLKQLADKVGPQDVRVFGIDSRTRAGRLLVEADYRMKLVGLGLEESVPGVPNYLASIPADKGNIPPTLDLIRWWFTLNYDAIRANASHDAFELRGQAVQVQSENEFLNAQGERVATGDSEPLNRLFAENFTKHFPELAKKYPVYADLQNIFDLAVVSALLKVEGIADRANWHGGCFLDEDQYRVPVSNAPKNVASVINHRVIRQTHIVAVVSGGVRIDPTKMVQSAAIEIEPKNVVSAIKTSAARTNQKRDVWWWD